MKLFDWDKLFDFKEIYPDSKVKHFTRIHETSGVEFKDMLFFDDDPRNIPDIQSKGVTCVLVSNGVTKQLVQEGLKKFNE